jgi:serine/threonine protein kinase
MGDPSWTFGAHSPDPENDAPLSGSRGAETRDNPIRRADDETLDARRAGQRAHRLVPGQTVEERYTVVNVLGSGGMGTVYRARDERADREVALKVLARSAGDSQERFAREGALTAALNHPGIIRVHACGHLPDGSPYLVYELIGGARTLAEDLPTRDLRGRITLVLEAAEAVAFAHERGVVHRDIKPENLLVDMDGRLRVADFGLAAAAGLERLTQTGAFVGTPVYMSPEQMRGLDPIAQMDVWSLGVVLFEALAGERPFLATRLIELMGQLMTLSEPPSPRSLKRDVPKGLDAICRRTLAPEVSARYPDARGLARDLRAWLDGEALSVTPGQRRPSRVWLIPALALIVFAGVAIFGTPQPTVERETPEAPVKRTARSADSEFAGQRRWREVKALEDEAEQLRGVDNWLRSFPGHSLQNRAASKRKRLAPRVPLWDQPFPGLAGARYLDGRRVILWGRKPGGLTVWTPGAQALEHWGRESVSALAVSSDAVAIATPRELQVRSLDGSRLFSRAHGENASDGRPIRALAISEDGSLLAAAGGLPDVYVYDMRSGELRASFPTGATRVVGLAFVGGGRFLAVLHSGRTAMDVANRVAIMDLEGALTRTVSLTGKPTLIVPLTGSVALVGYTQGALEWLELSQKAGQSLPAAEVEQHVGRVTDVWIGAEAIVSVTGSTRSRELARTTGARKRNDVRVWARDGKRLLGQGLPYHEPLLTVDLGSAGLLLAVGETFEAQIWHPDAVSGLPVISREAE